MNPFQKFFHKVGRAITGCPSALWGFLSAIGRGIANLFKRIGKGIRDYFVGFAKGNALTKGSYAIMGLGHIGRGQAAKGVIYLLIEALFILYMVFFGAPYLGKF
ncbi:MAG: hypothetical protein II493_02215, partial [Spirochaetales bacterium]|nr:hypothetical protein [Spirochaetales bacterium]